MIFPSTIKSLLLSLLSISIAWLVFIAMLLSSYWAGLDPASFVRALTNDIYSACLNNGKQLTIALGLSMCLLMLLVLPFLYNVQALKVNIKGLCFAIFIMLAFQRFITMPSYGIGVVGIITLLAGMITGRIFSLWVLLQKTTGDCLAWIFILAPLICFFVFFSIWMPPPPIGVLYHQGVRWSGAFGANPNIFGLLMGTGMVLSVGMGLRAWCFRDQNLMEESGFRLLSIGNHFKNILGLFCFLLMGRALLHSYSRGAWLSAAVGIGYLIFRHVQQKWNARLRYWNLLIWFRPNIAYMRGNWFPLLIMVGSIALLLFWQGRQVDWHPVRRALSAVNSVDFSWRNRVVAWVGDLQMMAEHPWLGAGWNRPEPLYEHYYLPNKLNESAAIQTNDYLMMGATLGVPALFCFGMYLWLSLSAKSESQNQKTETDWLCTTCRAGAIVLLVGFWFDGGLFKLPTAATFWILLELGNVKNREIRKVCDND